MNPADAMSDSPKPTNSQVGPCIAMVNASTAAARPHLNPFMTAVA